MVDDYNEPDNAPDDDPEEDPEEDNIPLERPQDTDKI